MTEQKPLNIIIAGIGGQGVKTAADLLTRMSNVLSRPVLQSVFKGGAQRFGSIHAQIRLFEINQADYDRYSWQVPRGEADLLLAFDPWEALRYHAYLSNDSIIICNSNQNDFFGSRNRENIKINPKQALDDLPNQVHIKNFTDAAIRQFNDERMANYLILQEAIRMKLLPFEPTLLKETYREAFNHHETIRTNL